MNSMDEKSHVDGNGCLVAAEPLVVCWEVDGNESVDGDVDALELVEQVKVEGETDEDGLEPSGVDGEAAGRLELNRKAFCFPTYSNESGMYTKKKAVARAAMLLNDLIAHIILNDEAL